MTSHARIIYRLTFFFLLLAVFWAPRTATAAVPQFTAPTVDVAKALTAQGRKKSDRALLDLQKKTGIQMAILIVPTLGDQPIEDFAQDVFDDWRIGSATRDDGVLYVLVQRDRRSRLAVGYGLEEVLTDGRAARILADLKPTLRDKDYDRAVLEVIAAVQSKVQHIRPEDPLISTPPLAVVQRTALSYWLALAALALGIFHAFTLTMLREVTLREVFAVAAEPSGPEARDQAGAATSEEPSEVRVNPAAATAPTVNTEDTHAEQELSTRVRLFNRWIPIFTFGALPLALAVLAMVADGFTLGLGYVLFWWAMLISGIVSGLLLRSSWLFALSILLGILMAFALYDDIGEPLTNKFIVANLTYFIDMATFLLVSTAKFALFIAITICILLFSIELVFPIKSKTLTAIRRRRLAPGE